MSKIVEIEFSRTHEGVPKEKIEEALNDLRKRLENFERGGVKADMRRIERTDIDVSKDDFQSQ